MAASLDVGIDFVTLGMFIIDEIHFPSPTPSEYNVLGGAGSFSALGARLFAPPPMSRTIGWIVDAGSDFPYEIRQIIESWETSCVIRSNSNRLTTRGWNQYGENEYRAFRYTTAKRRLDQYALTPPLLLSKSFHLICSPLRCIDLVRGILERRHSEFGRTTTIEPMFIWEPVPDLCKPEYLEDCFAALKVVDVVSPNHVELQGFFGTQCDSRDLHDLAKCVEKCSEIWLSAGIGKQNRGGVVVRAGEHGCYVATREISKWLPAYHENACAVVVDPTGGGNTFLGGLAMGLINGGRKPGIGNIVEAAKWGSVAASFAIEQVGLPKLTQGNNGEEWNGDNVFERLSAFENKISSI